MQNVGIIIGRFSPLHIGHISLINKSIESKNKTLVIIGSANKIDEKNPYTIKERLDILKKEFGDKILLRYINDYEEDKNWITYLNNIILSENISKEDFLYFLGGDLKNDYAIKIIKQYQENFKYRNIFFDEKPRNEIPISATEIRQLLKENNEKEIKKWLSEKTTYLIIKK
ncbi:MAG: adenylyltransferase/cytidyltransferase family protein [Candidatus Gracilibacteria bacterium]|nr:adenylyltransferase/cytidyltransferase family protein [Candidatus Gracilibacteria bacterium]